MTDLGFSIKEVVVATRDAEAAAAKFGEALNAEVDAKVSFPQEGIGIDMTGVWVGEFRLAFVQDATGSGHVARSIEKRGEGLFELCLRCNDLPSAMEHMERHGIRFTDGSPHVLENYEWHGDIWSEVRVAFVHPASSHGVQIELQQWVK